MTYPPQPPLLPPPGYPGQPYGYQPPGQRPDNYLVWSILVTVLCCVPFGIVAIINSAKVSGLWAAGQFAEAQKASENAKKFVIWGAIAGLVVSAMYAVVALSGGLSNM